MRRKYTKPSMSIDMFEANEYIAACYKIKCNVPNGSGYEDSNKNGKYDKNDKRLVKNARGCGIYHKGVNLPNKPTVNGFWKDSSGNVYNSFYWDQKPNNPFDNDLHFTLIDNPEWETNPNAS